MRLAVFLLTTALAHAADFTIDHVTAAGTNLALMEDQLAAAGLRFEFGGPHSNGLTTMAIASFADGSYLELIAPIGTDKQTAFDPARLAAHPWGEFILKNAGPCAWAVRPKDFSGEVDRIRSLGLPVKVESGGRTRPEGEALRWETAALAGETAGVFFPFLIRDQTPRPLRALPSGKPANREETGVLRVVIAVANLQDAVERFRLAYPSVGHPLKEVDARFGAELAWLPDTPVIFAAPLGSSSWVARGIERSGPGPCAFIFAAKKAPKGGTLTASRWFGRDIAWLDTGHLEWRLGIEQQ